MGEFSALIRALDGSPEKLERGIEAGCLSVFQSLPNRHGWRGMPESWRALILPRDALHIYWRHMRVFSVLGYNVPVYFLSRRRAEHNWQRLKL